MFIVILHVALLKYQIADDKLCALLSQFVRVYVQTQKKK